MITIERKEKRMGYTVKDALERITMYLKRNKNCELGPKDLEVLRGHLVGLAQNKEPAETVERTEAVNQDEVAKEVAEEEKKDA